MGLYVPDKDINQCTCYVTYNAYTWLVRIYFVVDVVVQSYFSRMRRKALRDVIFFFMSCKYVYLS